MGTVGGLDAIDTGLFGLQSGVRYVEQTRARVARVKLVHS
jgi:hypothetical protein